MDPNQFAELKPAILSIVEELRSVYSAGKDFALSQAPLVAKEMVYREAAKSVIWLAFGIFLAWAAKWLYGKFQVAAKENDRDPEVPIFFLGFALSAGIGISIIVHNCLDLFSVVFAPRLFILEEAAKLIH